VARGDPWPSSYIHQLVPSRQNVTDLEDAVSDASDERPVQGVLASTAGLWRGLLPSCQDAWCFSQPALGNQYVPDFLLCYRNSRGFNWILVELESPTKPPLNQNGRVAAKLNEAIGQVRDWRIWLRQNIAYAQNQLGYRGISAECPAWIVIGRRHMIEPRHALRYRELSAADAEIMTYDRLLEATRHSR
jgi:hypothetical protein